jgi:hypothetical protein
VGFRKFILEIKKNPLTIWYKRVFKFQLSVNN